MFDFLTTPVVIAHRGASAHAPENTLAAFHLAIEQGADAVEFDVQLTADKAVVVFHDSSLERTTNGFGKLKYQNLDYLKSLNAGKSYAPAYQDQQIPTLNEVFEEIGNKALLNVELKNLSSPFDDLPARVAQTISEHQVLDRVLISSFNPIALYKIEKLLPKVRKGILFHRLPTIQFFSNLSWFPLNYQTVHIPYKSLNSDCIASFHALGKLVFSYTLNHTHDIQNGLNHGLDGFFTDDPALARRYLLNAV
ncbi:MAG: glycerophosphodiester phosphodiesterase family protein [Anaerolineales bacterium]